VIKDKPVVDPSVAKESYEEYFKKIGTNEFFHSFATGGVAISLRIPISEVNGDIDSAIKKANKAGFDARVDAAYGYLEIAKYGYPKEDDQKVVDKLKEIAEEISKEDYSKHIKELNFDSHNTKIAQNNSLNYGFKGSVDETEVKLPKPTEDLVYFNKNGVELTRNSESENGNYFFFLKDITIDYTPVARIIGKLEKTHDGEILKITQIDQLPDRRNALILALSKVPDLPIRDILIKHFSISDNELVNAKRLYENESDVNLEEQLMTFWRQSGLPISIIESPIIESPISQMEKEGIPLTSDEKELQGKKLILFASKHNNTKEGEHLENILNRLLEDGKKRVIVLFETVSDPAINELLNNPEADEETIKKYYIPMFGFPEAAGNVVSALRRVLHGYGTERFEIVPIDVTSKEMTDRLTGLISEEEYEKNRYETIVNNVLKWYAEKKDSNDTILLAFTGADHVLDIYKKLIKNEKKEEIDKYVGVFVAPESKNNEDLSSILRTNEYE